MSANTQKASIWLWFSLPIAVLAIAGSILGISLDSVYRHETDNWAAQAVGQDIANLVVYPTLLVLAFVAARGSLRAYLAWTGLLAYSVYTYTIYAFDIHFGRLFLLYVAVLGLSVYALIGGLLSLDVERVKASFAPRTQVRPIAGLLIGLGVLFYLLWLSVEVPATVKDSPAKDLRDTGLLTNPVHVLDMAVFLPAMVVTGVMLRRGHAWGYCLAPTILAAAAAIGLGIIAVMVVTAERGLATAWGPTFAVALFTVIELVLLIRLLRAID